jgi:PAS domain S-box-containing protein
VSDLTSSKNNDPSSFIKLAEEQRRIAEIGRIVSSSLQLEEVYPLFTEHALALVHADRVVLAILSDDNSEWIDRCIGGTEIAGSTVGDRRAVRHDDAYRHLVVEKIPLLLNGDNIRGYNSDSVEEAARISIGFNSLLLVPLVWQGDSYGLLSFRAFDPDAFDQHQVELAEQISSQIAGAIATVTQLTINAKDSEEKDLLSEIGRIVSATLNLDDVFTAFADPVSKLISFDRLSISTIDMERNQISDAHVAGQMLQEGNLSGPYTLSDSIVPSSVYEDHKVLIANAAVLAERSKNDITESNRVRIAGGLASAMFVPVVFQGVTVGALIFRSKHDDPYGKRDSILAEQIAARIAGVIAARQQRSLLEAESVERERLAEEQRRIAEIGRIVNSTFDLDEVFSGFVEEARALLPFDRLVIITLSDDGNEVVDELVDGVDSDNPIFSKSFLFDENPLQDRVFTEGVQVVLGGDDYRREAEANPTEQKRVDSGLLSVMMTPMIWQGEVIGVINFRSTKDDAYGNHEGELGAQISAQIAGAVAASLQYKALEESEAGYRDLVESSHIIVWRMDAEGKFEYANNALSAILGYTQDEIIGSQHTDYQAPEVREEAIRNFKNRSDDTREGSGMAHYFAKDGSSVYFAFSSFAMFDAEKVFQGVRGTALDITAERVAQEELKVQSTALEEASDAVVVVSPDNVIRYVNNAFVVDTGYSKDEVIGKHASILRSPTGKNEVYDEIWATINDGNPWRGIIESRHKNGSLYEVDATINPIFTEDGIISSFVTIRRDISQRIAAEQDRQARAELDSQNQQLQQLSEQREQFFSTVSHELRTPLTAVAAFADILHRNRPSNLTGTQLNQVDVIRRNGETLKNLVEDMLDMSQASNNSLNINRVPFEINEMINAVVESLIPTARERSQSISVRLGTAGVWIDADKDRLTQVLSNLVTNASKYSPEKHSISIETRSAAGKLEIKVSDSGYGMAKEDLRMLFAPFYRSNREEIRNATGTGLGMSISKTLVELHGGEIEVESRLNRGTTVRVHIPGIIDRSQ